MEKVTTVNQLQTSVTRIAGNISTALNTVAESLEEMENLKADKTVATTSADGLMSASDKTKLDNLTAVADTDTFLTKTDAASTYVAKDGTKVLSTNDYTTAEKNKLSGIAESAQVNVIETVKVNNSALTPSNKAVNIDLTGYVTSSNLTSTLASYAKTSDISAAYIYKGSVNAFSNLPTSGYEVGDVWNIKTAGGTDETGTAIKAGDNVVYVEDTETPENSGWDALGGTTDLSGYVEAETGKGLSTNDFTTTYKNALDTLIENSDETFTAEDLASVFTDPEPEP